MERKYLKMYADRVSKIDGLVAAGLFKSRSEFIRHVVNEELEDGLGNIRRVSVTMEEKDIRKLDKIAKKQFGGKISGAIEFGIGKYLAKIATKGD